MSFLVVLFPFLLPNCSFSMELGVALSENFLQQGLELFPVHVQVASESLQAVFQVAAFASGIFLVGEVSSMAALVVYNVSHFVGLAVLFPEISDSFDELGVMELSVLLDEVEMKFITVASLVLDELSLKLVVHGFPFFMPLGSNFLVLLPVLVKKSSISSFVFSLELVEFIHDISP